MAIKLADTTRPNNYTNSDNPGTFPVAYAENVWLNDGTDLETFLADFDGNGGVQKEELPLASAAEEGNIYQYIGATGTYTNGYFYKCVEDSGSYSWVNIQVQDAGAETIVDVNSVPVSEISNVIYRTTDLSGDASYYAGNETASNTDQLAKYSDIQVIQVETLPTASANELGNIYEFVGTTTANYINGRFYRCVSDGASTPTYTWEEVDFGDGSVFIGTSSEWESETSKTDYQVAILTDQPTVNAVDSTDGSTTVVANKNLVFKGTLDEWEALTTAEKKTYDEALITNDMDTGEVVNGVTDGDMRAVTSNAVYDAIAPIGTVVEDTDHTNVTLVEGGADQTIRTLNLTTGTWIIRANVGWAMATSAQTVSISITSTTNTYNAGCYQGLDGSRYANQSCCIADIVTVTTASKNFYLTAWAAGAAEIVEHPYFSAVRII